MDDQVASRGAYAIVALPAEIGPATIRQVYERLYAAVASGAPIIIADLTGTHFCDAAGMRHLLVIREEAAARGSQLRLVIPPGVPMREVLVLLGADHLLPVYSSLREASGPLTARQDPLSRGRPDAARAE